MKLPTKLVAVKKITSTVARSSFSAEEIEKVANLIIKVEGTINPIILRRTSLESYEVVDGHFEYYAAVRAREISLLKGEMIQAIILEPENEAALLEQVDLLRKGSNPKPATEDKNNSNNSDLESRFANLERAFQLQFEELRKDNRSLESSLAEIKKKVGNSSFSEELINKIVTRLVEAVVVSRSSASSVKKTIEELKANPLDLNSASQSELATVPGIGEKTALRIVKTREQKGKFSSVEQLSEIEKITKNIIDKYKWHDCFVVHSSSK
ncbi:MAG: helix-hairpin-helix domain-containing protein [Xenococcus sp. (in: cyanobacteria)]